MWLLLGSFSGGIAGAIGLGGGTIYTPLLLSLDVRPRVATATTLYLTLFGRFSATLIYITIGWLHIPYSLLIGAVSGLGIYVAIKVIKQMIDKYQRPSIIVFVLAVILAASAIAVPFFSIRSLLREVESGKSITKFGNICSHHEVGKSHNHINYASIFL
jgi:uncharacterized membrane protein YfcA